MKVTTQNSVIFKLCQLLFFLIVQEYYIYISMANEGSSGSLIIAQGRPDFLVNSSEEKPKDDDLFQLSKDEPSLSLEVKEEKNNAKIRQIYRQSKEESLVFNILDAPSQDNRKKRKDIFEKFKKERSRQEEGNADSNILNIFDSIFNKKPDVANFCGGNDHSRQVARLNVENVSNRSRTPSAEKRARLKIFDKKKNTETYESVLPSNILNESQRFHDIKPAELRTQSVVQFQAQSPIMKKSQSLNFSAIQYRISAINLDDGPDISRDSLEINTILQSQIFRDEYGNQQVENRFSKNIVEIPEQIIKMIPNAITITQNQEKIKSATLIEALQSDRAIKQMPIEIQSPPKVIQKIQLKQPSAYQQIQETKYIQNDMSSLSSNPSMLVHNYQTLQGSMANINRKIFPENSPRNDSQTFIVESRIIEDHRSNIKHVFEEQMRLPVFLRKARKHISVYPNFYIFGNNPNTSEAIKQEFQILFIQIRKAVQFLSQMCQKVLDAKSKKQIFIDEILSLTVEEFVSSDWVNMNGFNQQFQKIRPLQSIEMRCWNYEKAKMALTNYENIVNYYSNKGVKIDPASEKGRKKYFDIRQKFWDICGNLKLISEDIFCEMRSCSFPQHYYEFHAFMNSPFQGKLCNQRLMLLSKLQRLYKYHKSLNDELVNSQIGRKILDKINLEMRYQRAF